MFNILATVCLDDFHLLKKDHDVKLLCSHHNNLKLTILQLTTINVIKISNML